MSRENKLLIKNMVCQRCIMTVEGILTKHAVPFYKVSLGEADLQTKISPKKLQEVEQSLNKVGFELIESRVNKIVEELKRLLLTYITTDADDRAKKLSAYISSRLHYDYSYLSDLFSSVTGTTIEQFYIVQRIEKVKELIVYEELSLTEISYRLGFSSVHHLSAQFKKATGLTPSGFKKIGGGSRKPIGES